MSAINTKPSTARRPWTGDQTTYLYNAFKDALEGWALVVGETPQTTLIKLRNGIIPLIEEELEPKPTCYVPGCNNCIIYSSCQYGQWTFSCDDHLDKVPRTDTPPRPSKPTTTSPPPLRQRKTSISPPLPVPSRLLWKGPCDCVICKITNPAPTPTT